MDGITRRLGALAAGTVLLAACAACATSPAGLKQPEHRAAARVDVPYQLALKRIADADRECALSPLVPLGQVINDVQNYPDLRMGSITKGASGVGTQIHQVIEVSEVDAAHAEVVLYTKMHRDKHLARLVRWAQGGTDCTI